MFKAKKMLSLVLALSVTATMALAGCGEKDGASSQSSTSTSTPSSTAATTVENELPPVELSWYSPVGTMPKDLEMVQAEVNKYTKEKINATVKLNFMDTATWKTKSTVMIAAGDDMDIMFTASWNYYRQSIAKGAFVDITDLFDKYCPKTKANLSEAYLEGVKANGRMYGVPTNKDLAHSYGIVYREDIAKKHNIDMSNIKSIQDLEPVLAIVKEKEPNMYPIGTGGGSGSKETIIDKLDWDPIGDKTIPGKLYPNKDTTVINEFEQPSSIELYRTMHKYFKAGYIRSDAATVKDTTGEKAGKNFLQLAQLKPLVDEDNERSNGWDYAQIMFTEPFITGADTQGSIHAIYRTSDNVERALMFLELVNSDSYLNNLINFGIENTHYVKKSENTIAFAPGLDGKTSGYYPNANWIFGNQFLNYMFEGNNLKKWDLYREFNNSGKPSKILGFDLNTEPIQTEIASCANVLVEYNSGLNTGTLDPDVYLPKMMEKLKSAGVDKIIAEKQKQIDAWLAATKK